MTCGKKGCARRQVMSTCPRTTVRTASTWNARWEALEHEKAGWSPPPGLKIKASRHSLIGTLHPKNRGTRMTVSDGCALPQPNKPSATEILDTPLPRLLARTNVELHDSSITDRKFFGAVVERKSGQLLLAMPAGRSEQEHDTVARYLLAKAFDVDLPDLPPPFATELAA